MRNEINYWQQKIDDYLLGRLSEDESENFEIYCFGHPEFLEEVRLKEQMLKLIKEERETLFAERESRKKTNLTIRNLSNFFQEYRLGKAGMRNGEVRELRNLSNFFQEHRSAWVYTTAAVVLLLALLIIPGLIRKDVEINLANFEESPALESRMGAYYRSPDFQVIITSPEKGANFKDQIPFQVDVKRDKVKVEGPFELKILNNKEVMVFNGRIENNQYILKEKLEPGLYYWGLEYKNELLYIGKFYIKKPMK